MNCVIAATSLHCLFGSGSLSVFQYGHPIESAWHKLEYNPAGGEALVDRLVMGSWVIQRIAYTGRAMYLGEDGKWAPR